MSYGQIFENISFRSLPWELECKKLRIIRAPSDAVSGPFGKLTILCISSGLSCWEEELRRWRVWRTWPLHWEAHFTSLCLPFSLRTAKICCDSACFLWTSLHILLVCKPVLSWIQSLGAVFLLTMIMFVSFLSTCFLCPFFIFFYHFLSQPKGLAL